MKILSIDPGETIGAVLMRIDLYDDKSPDAPIIEDWYQQKFDSVTSYTRWLYSILRKFRLPLVLVEDYRIAIGKATMHTGRRLFTAELIGATRACCAMFTPPIVCASLQPNIKGRWPEARIKAKYDVSDRLPKPHAHDALQLALAYIERELKWVP